MRSKIMFLLALALLGCSTSVTPKPDQLEISGHVTHAGQPVKSLTLYLQPIAGGGEAMVTVTDGAFTATVFPGTYTYYVAATDSQDLGSIPAEYSAGDMERQIEIADEVTLEIELD